jgi:penicillin-binding protein 1A
MSKEFAKIKFELTPTSRWRFWVAAASQMYFDKPIEELTIEEVALLATLPKAPSRLDPRKNMDKAKLRRDWVIDRMMEEKIHHRRRRQSSHDEPIIIKDSEELVR